MVRLSPCPTLVVRAPDELAGPPKRILVPTNGSVPSQHAADLAFLLATGADEEVLVLTAASAPDVLARLEANRQVVFRYAGPAIDDGSPWNPNGSLNHIAGICNGTRNVVGMMPHPERACEASLGSDDGRLVLESAVKALSSTVGAR